MEQHRNYLIKPIEKIGGGGFGVVEKVEIYNLHGQLCTDDTG